MFVSSDTGRFTYIRCERRWIDRTDGSVTDRLVLFANSGCVFLYLCMFALVLQCIFVEKCIWRYICVIKVRLNNLFLWHGWHDVVFHHKEVKVSTHKLEKEKFKGHTEFPKTEVEILEKGGPRPGRFRCAFVFCHCQCQSLFNFFFFFSFYNTSAV